MVPNMSTLKSVTPSRSLGLGLQHIYKQKILKPNKENPQKKKCAGIQTIYSESHSETELNKVPLQGETYGMRIRNNKVNSGCSTMTLTTLSCRTLALTTHSPNSWRDCGLLWCKAYIRRRDFSFLFSEEKPTDLPQSENRGGNSTDPVPRLPVAVPLNRGGQINERLQNLWRPKQTFLTFRWDKHHAHRKCQLFSLQHICTWNK